MSEPSTTVIPLARPPIRQSIVVRQLREATFATFVRRIGDWWPLTPFSSGTDRVVRVEFEEHVGGRIYEIWDDGTERDWGQVLEWRPPERFVMTWNITGEPTDVELRFTDLDDGSTRVDLEHRGWERLTEAQLGEDCALPGGYLGGSFTRGWATILRRFVAATEGEL
ncbi:MAG TPA: SRPBCC domain-containing protein [Pseudolysinimonas sp.]